MSNKEKSSVLAKVIALSVVLEIFFSTEIAKGIFFGVMGAWLSVSIYKEWSESHGDR